MANPAAFLCYAHVDDDHNRLTRFRQELSAEVRRSIGQEFPIFQDREDIHWGQNWRERIEQALEVEATFLIAILSPSFFNSKECRRELEIFLSREERLKRNDLVLPIYYVDDPGLNSAKEMARDPLRKAVAARQHVDWRDLRVKAFTSQPVREKIVMMAKQIRDALARSGLDPPINRGAAPTMLTEVPDLSLYFAGRMGELERLDRALRGSDPRFHIQAITGTGGVGKTQLAAAYAERHRQDFQHIFWVRASTVPSIEAAYAEMASTLGLPHTLDERPDPDRVREAIFSWLKGNSGSLLVLDNLDSSDAIEQLEMYIPTRPQASILITSRSYRPHVFDRLAPKPIRLPVLSPDEALNFLLDRTSRLDVKPAERQAAEKLVGELGLLPLALEQAAAYLCEHGSLFSSYLEEYRALHLELLEKHGPVAGDYADTIRTTWQKSIDSVRRESPGCVELLEASAFLAPDRIPYELIVRGAAQLGGSLAVALASASELEMDEFLTPLQQYSLIERNSETHTYDVHRLLQQVIREHVDSRAETLFERVVVALAQVFPIPEYDNWPACNRLIDHAQTCAERIRTRKLAFSEAGDLLDRAGNYLQNLGQFGAAQPLLCSALTIRRAHPAGQELALAKTANGLASLYYRLRRYEEAEALYEEARDLRTQVLGAEHPDVAAVLTNLGNVYNAQKRYAKAAEFYERALKCQGRDPKEEATTRVNLATVYHRQGLFSEAQPLYERALELRRAALRPRHPDIAKALINLGCLYRDQMRLSDAEDCFTEAMSILEEALGREHPDFANALLEYAKLRLYQGRFSEALRLASAALTVLEKRLGPEHPTTLEARRLIDEIQSKLDNSSPGEDQDGGR